MVAAGMVISLGGSWPALILERCGLCGKLWGRSSTDAETRCHECQSQIEADRLMEDGLVHALFMALSQWYGGIPLASVLHLQSEIPHIQLCAVRVDGQLDRDWPLGSFAIALIRRAWTDRRAFESLTNTLAPSIGGLALSPAYFRHAKPTELLLPRSKS
tara:strand:+ start:255 stop:731 length:477 start_codon:yes stop_codon:yes gene_type:complete